MSEYSEFFLKAPSAIVQLELLTIAHPSFSQVFNIVRNAIKGVTVTLETGEVQFFDYYPLKIEATGAANDLDSKLKCEFGDLGGLLPQQLDLCAAAGTFRTFPTLTYRTYRSDILTAPLYGPIYYVIPRITFNKTGNSFEAQAQTLNLNSTGEIYTTNNFPMLGGFIQ